MLTAALARQQGKMMASALPKGITVSFSNTPQAKGDSYTFTESVEGSIQYLDVMANDLGGNAKSLYAIDNGVNVDLSERYQLYSNFMHTGNLGSDPKVIERFPEIVRAGYPDHFSWTTGHKYYDAGSKKDAPTWYTVDIAFAERFPGTVSLETLKSTKGLENMMVTKKGSRLSIQPVTKPEYDIVVRLGRAAREAG